MTKAYCICRTVYSLADQLTPVDKAQGNLRYLMSTIELALRRKGGPFEVFEAAFTKAQADITVSVYVKYLIYLLVHKNAVVLEAYLGMPAERIASSASALITKSYRRDMLRAERDGQFGAAQGSRDTLACIMKHINKEVYDYEHRS